jgi:hypothetical protein
MRDRLECHLHLPNRLLKPNSSSPEQCEESTGELDIGSSGRHVNFSQIPDKFVQVYCFLHVTDNIERWCQQYVAFAVTCGL